MRNRAYMPQLGRFLQPDPNATALTLIGQRAFHGSNLYSLVGFVDIGSLYVDGCNLNQYGGSNPWQGGDPLGLEWVDDYQGVILNVVSVVDSFLPVSLLGPLMELLDGYHLMIRTAGFVQGAAYDAEEHLDWALNWDASDSDNPRFGTYGGFSDAMLVAGAAAVGGPTGGPVMAGLYPSRSLASGRAGERISRNSGKMNMRRKTSTGRYDTTHDTTEGRRFYDGVDPTDANKMIEVKIGRQGLTERVRRQITKDAALMRDTDKKVKWVLFERKGTPVNGELVNTLKAHGIEVEILGAICP
ncbi:MAG: hypothetical protein KF743_14335, partial [Fimbriimonadaceae bacterium]|nr:hypothetical protein [Fimbriimonadaceae bacterium]